MLTAFTSFCLSVMDLLLGWSLQFHKIVPLILLGIGEALVITLIQKYCTNQDLLKRMKFDRARLKTLTQEAKKKGDREAVKRHRSTGSMIGARLMKAEILPIFLSILPIAFIATWAFSRMPYLPLQASQPITVKADFPTSQIGNLVSMVPPADGALTCTNGWIQKVVELRGGGQDQDKVIGGIATWQLHATGGAGDFTLPIRYKGETFSKKIRVGGTIYEDPVDYYNPEGLQAVEVDMSEYKPLGVLPAIPSFNGQPFWRIPPWLVGDLILVIPLSLLFRPLLRVY